MSSNQYWIRPGVGSRWWPNEPPPTGGHRVWSDEYIIDMFDEVLRDRAEVKAKFKEYQAQLKEVGLPTANAYKRFPAFRSTKALKSSPTHKVFVGGPYAGLKLKANEKVKRTPRGAKGKKVQAEVIELRPILGPTMVVKGWSGRYRYNLKEDKYLWE